MLGSPARRDLCFLHLDLVAAATATDVEHYLVGVARIAGVMAQPEGAQLQHDKRGVTKCK